MDEKELLQEMESPCCAYHHEHPMLLEDVHEAMPQDEEMLHVSELFKVLGDGTRMRILFVLLASEMCVCDLSEALGMSVSAVSHQLRILRQAHLVRYRRVGKTVFYALADDHVKMLLSQGLDHVRE